MDRRLNIIKISILKCIYKFKSNPKSKSCAMDHGKLILNLSEGEEEPRIANTSFKNNQFEEVALPEIKI